MLHYLLKNKITSYGATDIGLVRHNNEDVWVQLPAVGLYMLADGMGGHQAGEVAAKETIEGLSKIFNKRLNSGELAEQTLEESLTLLKRAIIYVNGKVFKLSRTQDEYKGMGTTLCCLLFLEEHLIIAHVGDSRIYRLRNSKFEQLTKDHSLLCDLVDQGQLSNRQASDFVYKNIITKAIGTEPKVEPTIASFALQQSDIYLMCSDGLSDFVEISEIEKIIANAPSLPNAVEHLIAVANLHGGRDNITVVLVRVEGGNETQNLS